MGFSGQKLSKLKADGDLNMGGYKFTNLGTPVATTDSARPNMGGVKMSNLGAPSDPNDSARKVDLPSALSCIPVDLTATRLLDTEYTNNDDVPILVEVRLQLAVLSSATSLLGNSGAVVYRENVSPPSIQVVGANLNIALYDLNSGLNSMGFQTDISFTFIVPAGWIYKLESAVSGDGQPPAIYGWFETPLS